MCAFLLSDLVLFSDAVLVHMFAKLFQLHVFIMYLKILLNGIFQNLPTVASLLLYI